MVVIAHAASVIVARRSIHWLSLGFPVTRYQHRQTEPPSRHIRATFRHMTLTIVINKNQPRA